MGSEIDGRRLDSRAVSVEAMACVSISARRVNVVLKSSAVWGEAIAAFRFRKILFGTFSSKEKVQCQKSFHCEPVYLGRVALCNDSGNVVHYYFLPEEESDKEVSSRIVTRRPGRFRTRTHAISSPGRTSVNDEIASLRRFLTHTVIDSGTHRPKIRAIVFLRRASQLGVTYTGISSI